MKLRIFNTALFSIVACSQVMAEDLWVNANNGNTALETVEGYDSVVVQSNATIGAIQNTENGTFLNVQAELTVNSDLTVKQISLNQYDKKCVLTVNGDLTLVKNSKGEDGTLTIAQGEAVNVTGTTTINGSLNMTRKSTLSTSKLVINGQSSISDSSISADEVVVNHTFTLLSGSISALDGEGTMTVGENGRITQQGAEIDLETVITGGHVDIYKGSFADVTLNEGSIAVKGNTSAQNITLSGGEIVFNEGCTIDLGGNALSIGDDAVIRLLFDSENGFDRACTLFTNIGEGSEGLENLTIIVSGYDGSNETTIQASIKDGKISATVPEPATATLSLLALAALAARRRRK